MYPPPGGEASPVVNKICVIPCLTRNLSSFLRVKSGFTLIELLVVVLIIGILASIAVPQYQKAVEKSRATQAITLLKSLRQAAVEYHMASGTFPLSFDELSIDLPWTGTEKGIVMSHDNIKDTRSNGEWSAQLYRNVDGDVFYMTRISGKYKGGGFLVTMNTNSQGNIFCTERTSAGVTFGLNAGDFCTRIMSGTYQSSFATYRQYTLP